MKRKLTVTSHHIHIRLRKSENMYSIFLRTMKSI